MQIPSKMEEASITPDAQISTKGHKEHEKKKKKNQEFDSSKEHKNSSATDSNEK